jgi:hypothetical protein
MLMLSGRFLKFMPNLLRWGPGSPVPSWLLGQGCPVWAGCWLTGTPSSQGVLCLCPCYSSSSAAWSAHAVVRMQVVATPQLLEQSSSGAQPGSRSWPQSQAELSSNPTLLRALQRALGHVKKRDVGICEHGRVKGRVVTACLGLAHSRCSEVGILQVEPSEPHTLGQGWG